MIDKTSIIDIISRLERNQARKILSAILNRYGLSKISFTRHCLEELQKDNMTVVDVFNVLKRGQIFKDPEWTKGTYRYRVETSIMLVVIGFSPPDCVRCVTAWRKKI